MAGMSSCANLFEKRGDKWLTDKEKRDVFNLSFADNPDFDQFAFATKRKAREKFVDPVGKPIEATYQRRGANICARMHAEIREATEGRVIRGKEKVGEGFYKEPPDPLMGGQNKLANTFTVYVKRIDGSEKEQEYKTAALASKRFAQLKVQRRSVAVEIWSMKTGEMTASYTRKR